MLLETVQYFICLCMYLFLQSVLYHCITSGLGAESCYIVQNTEINILKEHTQA